MSRSRPLRGARLPALAAALLAALASLAPTACRKPSGAPGPFRDAPVILISIDTLRSDRLPAYGYRGVATPAIDGLARDAVLFERAYAQYPMTLPSHVSLMTGLLPSVHGVRDNLGYRLDTRRHRTLARLFRDAGYATGAAVSSLVLSPDGGLGDGFDFYEATFPEGAGTSLDYVQRAGAETVRLALEWLRPRAQQKLLFFLHLYEPHAPYDPPEPYASRYGDRYDGEIAAADAAVGELLGGLRQLGLYDRAIVVLLSDHGEGLGEHGEEQHGSFLYRTTLQVPLLVKLPRGERAGSRRQAPVSLTDLAPTLTSLAGLPPPPATAGPGLFAAEDGAEERLHYAETFHPRLHYGWSDLASAIRGSMHYIEAPEPELYDLAADPGETRNLVTAERRTYAALRDALRPLLQPLSPPNQEVDPEAAAQLAALGYLGGGATTNSGPLPDPKGQRPALAEFSRAYRLYWAGEPAAAVEALKPLVAANPRMLDGWEILAQSLQRLGRHAEAAEAYRRGIELTGGAPQWLANAASNLYLARRFDEARQHAELAAQKNLAAGWELLMAIAAQTGGAEAVAQVAGRARAAGRDAPELQRKVGFRLLAEGRILPALTVLASVGNRADAPALVLAAVGLTETGHQAEAAEVLDRALRLDSANAAARETLGIVELRRNRLGAARTHLEGALAIDEQRPIAWNTLGVVRYRSGAPTAACDAWRRAVALDPSQFDALFNLGLVLADTGQAAEARAALTRFVATAPAERHAGDLARARHLLSRLPG